MLTSALMDRQLFLRLMFQHSVMDLVRYPSHARLIGAELELRVLVTVDLDVEMRIRRDDELDIHLPIQIHGANLNASLFAFSGS